MRVLSPRIFLSVIALLLMALMAASFLPARPSDSVVAKPNLANPVIANAEMVQARLASINTIETEQTSTPLSPYTAALRPAFAGEIGQMADWPRYDLSLRIDPIKNKVTGTQQVIYTHRDNTPLREIALRLYPNTDYMEGKMTLSAVQINGKPIADRTIRRNGRADRATLLVPLSRPLSMGQQVTLSMQLDISVPVSPTKGYRTFGLIDGILSLPNAYAMVPPRRDGRWWLDSIPIFGDVVLGQMALYRVRIQAPKEQVIVATGVCESDRADSANDAAVVCSSGPVRDFAIHLSPHYRVVSATLPSEDITVYSYYLPTHERAGENALDYAEKALKTYERRFGPYPYRELKVFETTTIAGGIEYPMLAGVTDANYELDGGYFEWLVAHEVAHQWWYNMVGSDPITEPWLDESLTQYAASLYIEDRYGDVAARAQRDLFFNQRYENERKAKGDRRVGQPSALFPRWSYFPIVYGKGPLFFEEVRRKGGDSRFEAWLRTYFVHNRFAIANANALLQAANDVGLREITQAAYDEWIMGKRSRN